MSELNSKACSACFQNIDSRSTRCAHCGQRQGDVVGLYRNVPGRALGGVSASIAHHFNWDVTLMRILFVVSIAFTGGLVFWVYAAAWAMTPFEQNGKSPALKAIDWLGGLFSAPKSTGVEPVQPQ